MVIFLKAFLFAVIAGLSTVLGGIFSTIKIINNKTSISFMLGASAGFIMYISMVELLNDAFEYFASDYSGIISIILTVVCIIVGVGLILIVDNLTTLIINKKFENTNSDKTKNSFINIKLLSSYNKSIYSNSTSSVKLNSNNNLNQNQKLWKSGVMTAVAIALHNMPEGIITFMTTLTNSKLAVVTVIAIALHNIPEGMAVAVQIHSSTNNRKKAILYSLYSGLTEPIGALLGFFVLYPFLNNFIFGMLFALVAGIMIIVCIKEIIPSAYSYNKPITTSVGFVVGVVLMFVLLQLLH